jgi:hypothetical protein
VNIALRVPPLSLWKSTRVSPRMPFLSSAASTRAIWSSLAVIDPAQARRLGSAMPAYRSRYSWGA